MRSIHMETRSPFFTRSGFFAPIFCAVKEDMLFPSAVKEVTAKVLSLIAAEYPARMAEESNELTSP